MAGKSRRPPVSRDKRFKQNPADMGPPERWQHGGRVLEYTGHAGVFAARATEEHVLDRLLLLRLIDSGMHAAALRFLEDYTDAGLEGRVTASYSGMRGSRAHDTQFERSPAQESAYRRWRRAAARLIGSEQDVALSVICAGHVPPVHHLAVLKRGLLVLLRHYGMPK